MSLSDRARAAIEEAIWLAAEDGASEDEVRQEFEYDLKTAVEDGSL